MIDLDEEEEELMTPRLEMDEEEEEHATLRS
jgi:hypothetical protein